MLYSVHYFVVKTKMTGFFQTAFYFGYTAMFCLGARACPFLGKRGTLLLVAPPAPPRSAPPPTRSTACRPPTAGLSTMCGAVGYLGALAFVRRIFRGLKVD